MSGVYLCVCACTTTYLHLRYTRPCPYYRCTAARHETHHGHVLRHAIEQVYYHGHDPPRTIHPHLCRWLLRRSRDLDILVSFAPRLFSSFLFFRLLCVWLSFSLLDTLLFRILRVIGSKVNRSKVIFSSRSLSSIPRERSVSCLSPFFILANRASFFHVILSPFSSHLYPSTSLSLFYSAESLYKFEKDDARTVEKSIDGNWSATHSTVDKLDRTCWGCEFKLKVPLILGEIFVNRWRTCSTKLYVLTFLINYVWQ